MADAELERLTSESQATQMKRKDLKEEEQKLKEALRIVSRSFDPVEEPYTSQDQISEHETRSKGKESVRNHDSKSTFFSVPLNPTTNNDPLNPFHKTASQSWFPSSGRGLFPFADGSSGNSDNSTSSGFGGTSLFGSSSKTSSSSSKFSDHPTSNIFGSAQPKPFSAVPPFSFGSSTTSSESQSNIFGQSSSSGLFDKRPKSADPTSKPTSTLFSQMKGHSPSPSSSKTKACKVSCIDREPTMASIVLPLLTKLLRCDCLQHHQLIQI